MNIHPLRADTAEKIPVIITTTADPTGTAPTFALTADTIGATTTDPFVAGEWSGTWNTTTGEIDALTPLVGDGQALDVDPDTDYQLHAAWTVGTETPEKDVIGIVRVG